MMIIPRRILTRIIPIIVVVNIETTIISLMRVLIGMKMTMTMVVWMRTASSAVIKTTISIVVMGLRVIILVVVVINITRYQLLTGFIIDYFLSTT